MEPTIVKESHDTSGVDIDALSRVIPILGLDAIRKLKRANVLVCGLDGLGVEVAKNIILCGPGKVTVHDNKKVALSDLSSQFFLTPADVGKSRVDVCLPKLRELNTRSCKVSAHTGDLSEDFIKQFRVVVLANFGDQAEAERIGDICHGNKLEIPSDDGGEPQFENSIFILCDTRGVFARIFSDFGVEHKILDKNGEEAKTRIISSISRTHNAEGEEDITKIATHEDEPHGFADGDYVKFTEVRGMTEVNSEDGKSPKIFKVKETKGLHGLWVELDSSDFGEYTGGGLITQVKVEIPLTGKAYREASRDPGKNSPLAPIFHSADWAKEHRNSQYYFGWQALYAFQASHAGELPQVGNDENVAQVVELAKKLNEEAKKAKEAEGEESTICTVDSVDEELIQKLAKYSRGDLNPMAAFIGGIVGQEVLKLTGKFHPINQWFFFDALEVLDESVTDDDRKPTGSRYDGQIAVIGKTLQEQLNHLNVFMIGAGALGCEYLKNFAVMGVSSKGKFTVTDMDNIEVSNLTRQFLFRDGDVEKMKAPTAAAAAKAMNPDFNIFPTLTAVGPNSEDEFNCTFWEGLDIVVNAVDNIKARLYVDEQCVFYNKPLLESGTLGTKANSQVIYPHMTESYGSSRDPPEKAIPMCTLKNFPNQIEHCIEWARDKFGGLFTNAFDDANNFVANPEEFFRSINAIEAVSVRKERLRSVVDVLTLARDISFDKCIEWARHRFQDYFFNTISQLLFNFPPDAKTSSGADFWSGPKRPPTPIEFDPEDHFHVHFIIAAANLLADCYRIKDQKKGEEAKDQIAKKAAAVSVPPFKPSSGVRIKAGEEDDTEEGTDRDEDDVKDLLVTLEGFKPEEFSPPEAQETPFEAASFEKDDDANYHIAFMTNTANMRALNYNIPTTTFVATKSIAGRITPAIATTTAMITGAVGLEFYKAIKMNQKPEKQDKDIEQFRNTFVNLALPVFVQSEPMPCVKHTSKEGEDETYKAIPEGWTLWDNIVIEGDLTFQGFMDWWEENHKLSVVSITCGSKLVFNEFFPAHKARLPLKISEYVRENVDDYVIRDADDHIKLVVLVEDPDNEDMEIDLPDPICLKFRHL